LELGAHLTLIAFVDSPKTLARLRHFGLSHLEPRLEAEGRDAAAFPNGVVTAWLHVAENPAFAEQRTFVWPLGDELEQPERFRNGVVPLLSDPSGV